MGFTLRKDRGWAQFQKALDGSKFKRILAKHLRRASRLNGKLAEAAVRTAIRRGVFAANAPLTIMIKGSSKPLVDNNDLANAVSSTLVSDTELFVGFTKTSDLYDIALSVHEGVEIRVTPSMRGLFFALWQASIGKLDSAKLTGRAKELWERQPGGWLPLKDSTNFISIPARRFLEEAMSDEEFKRRVKQNWERAVEAAVKELVASAKG